MNKHDEYDYDNEQPQNRWTNPAHWLLAIILCAGWFGYGKYSEWVAAKQEAELQIRAELEAAYPSSQSFYLHKNDDGSPTMVWNNEYDAFAGIGLLRDQVENGFDFEKLKLAKEYLSCTIDTPTRVSVTAMKEYGLTLTIFEGEKKGCIGFAS